MWICKQSGSTVVLVHNQGEADDAAFARTLERLAAGARTFLPFAYRDAILSARQRRDMGRAAKHVRVAAVMESGIQRSIATAVGWFVPALTVFSTSPEDLERAYAHIGVEGNADVRATVLALHDRASQPHPARLP